MPQPVRRKRRKKNNQGMLLLIGVLLLVLIVMVVIALTATPKDSDPKDHTTGPASSDGTTAPTASPTGLVVTSPEKTELVVLESQFLFEGTSDPKESLTINGVAVQRTADGSFSHPVTLKTGVNEITVSHKGQSVTYRLEYRYAVQSFAPAKPMSYNCGATVQVEVFARAGSTLKVTLGSTEVKMSKAENQVGSGIADGFIRYTGTYKMPASNTSDQEMGQFTYTVTCDGVTETYKSGTITCLKMAEILNSDPSVTPDYGDYIDVGSGYIVEIITYSAETFDGKTTDDYSNPRHNYLPEGTVDYCAKDPLKSGGLSYIKLRCGRRVYVTKHNWPSKEKVQIVDCYRGTLPDHNEIGFASLTQSGNHTILTLDSLWKAPFYFDLEPQQYINPSDRDYRVTALTAEYVDITFCYATSFAGTVTIPANNPLFKSAELTQNESDCTLRLYLKKTGGFYGWDAYYNENDQLCFRFLNPAKATASSNAYGADLTGVRIMLDVGHGGIDGGSPATLANGTQIDEAELNLRLANILKKKLESMGATVIMNRTDDSPLNVDERIQYLIEQAPDLCIAIHQNSIAGYPNINGCQVLYFTPFSQLAAKLVYEETVASGVYNKTLLDSHVYFVARQTSCPVVLTENGYMSNANDLANMTNEAMLEKKADAMAQGAADYFLAINK